MSEIKVADVDDKEMEEEEEEEEVEEEVEEGVEGREEEVTFAQRRIRRELSTGGTVKEVGKVSVS